MRLVSASVAGVVAGMSVLLALPEPVMAQIEEVLVTTRKREESLQEVPIAVTAITADQIERQGIADLGDVAALTPSLQFDTAYGQQDVRITVRGLSNTRGRSNVAFLVDGIDVTTENVISAGSGLLANRRLLTDVERIEVVKGPQSALYGRAAFAGAISYITREPGDTFEGKVSADVADYGSYQVEGAFGGPVFGDTFGLRLTGVYWDEDGFYQNSVSGADVGGGEGYGTALTGVWRPTDSLKVKARLEFSDDSYEPPPTVRIAGDTDLPYPAGAVNPASGVIVPCLRNPAILVDRHDLDCDGLTLDQGLGWPTSADTGAETPFLGLFNHGLTFRLPRSYGDASGKQVRLSENWRTGGEYPGSDIQVFRPSLTVNWDAGIADVTSFTGYTDADFSQLYDQDYQARGRPDTLIAHQESNTDATTRQFSQELRVQSNFDGPVQVTLGALYWEEERDLVDNNTIIACMPVGRLGSTTPANPVGVVPATGICDGTNGTISSWQEMFRQLAPMPSTLAKTPEAAAFRGGEWEADTDSWSYYGMLEWQMTDSLKLTFENRLVVEDFHLRKANQSSCAVLGWASVNGVPFGPSIMFSEDALPGLDNICEAVNVLANGFNANDQLADWAYIQGDVSSRFNTPKVTLEWSLDDDRMLYFSWAHAQKPGGISTLNAGGSPVSIVDEFFEPEKMRAWELGLKSTWQAAGALQANVATFFQDYTDKQISTQVLVDGQLQPRVVNASAAEVWGVELDTLWQPEAVEGLTLMLAYTWLDAEYTDFFQETRSLPRVAANQQCDPILKDALNAQGQPAPQLFCRVDFSGNRLERTPRNALMLGGSLRRPFLDSAFDWQADLNANYQDERFLDEDNFTRFDDYWLVDARLGLISDRLDITVYVDNLFDDDTLKTGGSGPDFAEQVSVLGFTAGLGVTQYFGTLPDPRVFGVRFSYRFGEDI